jgi:DNA-binding SARP family transcriptional activator
MDLDVVARSPAAVTRPVSGSVHGDDHDSLPPLRAPVPGEPVTLGLVGGLELTRAGTEVDLSLPTQRMLGLLALSRRPLHREHVAGALWGDREQHRAAANLRSALWRLRSVPDVIVATRTHLRLHPAVDVDVHRIESLARRVLAVEAVSAACPEVDVDPARCTALLEGDILPGWYDDWVEVERERLSVLRIGALEHLSAHWRHQGRWTLAIDAALSAIRAEPMREGAHAALIEAHLAAGNRGEALRRFEQLQFLLRSELGLSPSADLQHLMTAVVGDGHGVPSATSGWTERR